MSSASMSYGRGARPVKMWPSGELAAVRMAMIDALTGVGDQAQEREGVGIYAVTFRRATTPAERQLLGIEKI